MSHIEPAVRFYAENIDVQAVENEFVPWKTKWSAVPINNRPSNALDALSELPNLSQFYPNIVKLLKILATLPVTTASAERSFSCLGKLKTYLKNTMGQSRLSGLAIMQMNRNEIPNERDVLDELAKSRRKIGLLM